MTIPRDLYMTIDGGTVGPAAVILLAAENADDPHHAGTVALLLATLDLALQEVTTSPISDGGTPRVAVSTPAHRCEAITALPWPLDT